MNIYDNPKLKIDNNKNVSGIVGWKSPSNIALIKYWGKYGNQLPLNPSISFTLSQAYTQTTIEYKQKKKDNGKINIDFYFEGKLKPEFARRINKYFKNLIDIFPFLTQLNLEINSDNSFPHSSGIASSASSMSSLALSLCSIERNIFNTELSSKEFFEKASFIARLGSGSACRSIYPKAALWGQTEIIPKSSNYYAIPVKNHLHDNFRKFHDDILIVSKKAKSKSSSDGHAIMSSHRFKDGRILQANKRLYFILNALKSGDYETFGEIVENEAFTLHGLMMSSSPAYVLMEPNTLNIINQIKSFRKNTKIPVFFSLDAGPNVHLLYPDSYSFQVQEFLDNSLVKFCKDGDYIKDYMGTGPKELDF
jgi:diphosphomevalonate decarboxylase